MASHRGDADTRSAAAERAVAKTKPAKGTPAKGKGKTAPTTRSD